MSDIKDNKYYKMEIEELENKAKFLGILWGVIRKWEQDNNYKLNALEVGEITSSINLNHILTHKDHKVYLLKMIGDKMRSFKETKEGVNK